MPTVVMIIFFGIFGLACNTFAETIPIPKNTPVKITADRLDYDRATEIYVASGNVRIEQQGIQLEADSVVLNNQTGDAVAEGNVILQDKGDVTRADRLKINIATRAGVIYHGDIFLKKDNLHVKGDLIERRSETNYHVEQGILTTCDEDEWFIEARELNVDLDRYATAKGVSFNILDVPVFYTPYFLFPVKRQTGFLIPEIGNSSLDGPSVHSAFFWAISDYRDMTVYSDFRAKTGHGTGLEYRYNNSNESSGKVFGKFWNMFRTKEVRQSRFAHETSESRWELQIQHKEEFAEDLSGRVDINLVSDENYYFDLDKQLETKSKPYLDSNAFYVERWNTAALYVLGNYTTDLTRSNSNTIQKLPEIKYTLYHDQLLGPIYVNFDGSAVNFLRQKGDGWRRVDLNPQISSSFGTNGLNFAPRAGVRGTFYDRSGPDASVSEPVNRTYVYAGADLNARISRIYGTDQDEGIGKTRHSIEPTISYSYLSHFGRSKIPQVDLVDSVISLNTVTVSIINRFSAHYKASKESPQKTFDMVVFKLSQGYNLTGVETTSPTMANHYSNVQADLSLQAPEHFSLTANGTYNPDTGYLSSRSVTAGFDSKSLLLNLTYQSARDSESPSEYVIGGGTIKVGKWEFSAQTWYDLFKKSSTQQEFSVFYKAQCWGIKAAFTHNQGESRITAMFDLKGLGGFGK
ncbi:MAG: LPS assembly protein LptD [Nitrospirota bacterium]